MGTSVPVDRQKLCLTAAIPRRPVAGAAVVWPGQQTESGEISVKNALALLTALMITLGLAGCGGSAQNAVIDYGVSDIYSAADMDAAVGLIKNEFAAWDGCELHSIRYGSDRCNSEENVKWMNDLGGKDAKFTQCIEFVSDFHSPKDGGDGWIADHEYTNWRWWLARTDNGAWKLMTWGY